MQLLTRNTRAGGAVAARVIFLKFLTTGRDLKLGPFKLKTGAPVTFLENVHTNFGLLRLLFQVRSQPGKADKQCAECGL